MERNIIDIETALARISSAGKEAEAYLRRRFADVEPVTAAQLVPLLNSDLPTILVDAPGGAAVGDLNPGWPSLSFGDKHTATAFEVQAGGASWHDFKTHAFALQVSRLTTEMELRLLLLKVTATFHFAFLQAPTIYTEAKISHGGSVSGAVKIVAKVFALVRVGDKPEDVPERLCPAPISSDE